ncbi:unnamed protein product, partial [Rotaria sordida]
MVTPTFFGVMVRPVTNPPELTFG